MERTDWWDYVVSVPAPRVVVVQDVATNPGSGRCSARCTSTSCGRSVASARLPTAPCGTYRRPKSLASNFSPAASSVSHAYVHIVEFGTPVEIGGLKIQSGDLLHGDRHGVQSIPEDIATQIPPVAAEIAAEEQALIKLCQSPEFSIEKLRAAVNKDRP